MDRNNNFDVIRLVAALQVAFLHSAEHFHVPLGGLGRFLDLFPGVPVFFYMSGMMVTASAMRRPLKDYAEARARRIVPALWMALALALVILIAFGQVGAREAQDPVFWLWVGSQLTVFQVFNPDLFRDFGVGVVNGSLWTIPVEVGFYLILPLLLFFSRKDRRISSILFAVGALVTFAIGYYADQVRHEILFAKLLYATPLAHFWLFALGALTYLHIDRLKPLIARLPWWAPLAAYIVFAYVVQPFLPGILGAGIRALLLCSCALWAGLGAPVVVGVLRGNDISYGLYVYHMLVVNTLVALGYAGVGPIVVALAVSVVIAVLSWRYLEQIVLRRRPARAAVGLAV